MYVIEFTVRQSTEIVFFGDIVITVNYPAVTESAGSVAASDYRRNARAFKRCDQSLIIVSVKLIDRVTYMHSEPESLYLIDFSVSDRIPFLPYPCRIESYTLKFFADKPVHRVRSAHKDAGVIINILLQQISSNEAMFITFSFLLGKHNDSLDSLALESFRIERDVSPGPGAIHKRKPEVFTSLAYRFHHR